MLKKYFNLIKARNLFHKANNLPPQQQYRIPRILKDSNECRIKAGGDYTDIGITEYDFNQLLKQGHLADAKYWLEYARHPKDENTWQLEMLDKNLHQAGATYADIGTTTQEIVRLQKLGYTIAAQKKLIQSRECEPIRRTCLHSAERLISMAGLTLAHIGALEWEIALIRKKAA